MGGATATGGAGAGFGGVGDGCAVVGGAATGGPVAAGATGFGVVGGAANAVVGGGGGGVAATVTGGGGVVLATGAGAVVGSGSRTGAAAAAAAGWLTDNEAAMATEPSALPAVMAVVTARPRCAPRRRRLSPGRGCSRIIDPGWRTAAGVPERRAVLAWRNVILPGGGTQKSLSNSVQCRDRHVHPDPFLRRSAPVTALWYFGRASGVTALGLFSLVVVVGIAARSGRPFVGLPRFAVAAVHRQISLCALAFIGLHIGTLWLDPYAHLRLTDLLVPFLAHYRPLWQGLGTLAAELVVVLVLSSLVRNRLGPRAWRAVHWAAYLCWPLAVAHAVGTGTDRSSRWLLLTVAGCVLAVGVTVAWRMTGRPFADEPRPRRVAPPTDLAGMQR